MKYRGKNFDAIVATPGCGKSYLCDKYPDKFVDVDEERLKLKYVIPENITRAELESTKGDRPFPRRYHGKEILDRLYAWLDKYVSEGKTLILAPHPEAIDYLVMRNIRFAFVFQGKDMKEEQIRRMKERGNAKSMIDSMSNNFEYFYEMNQNENKSALHYEFGPNEYLEDIVKKFGYKL